MTDGLRRPSLCLVSLVAAALLAAPVARCGESSGWVDLLDREGVRRAAAEGVARRVGGSLVVRPGEPAGWTLVELARWRGSARQVEIELAWRPSTPGSGGEVQTTLDGHAFGSSSYRIVVSREPWRVVECQGPAWAPQRPQHVGLRVRPGAIEYWLEGELVARSPAVTRPGAALRLAVRPPAQVTVKTCRWRPAPDGAHEAAGPPEPRLVYAPARFPHRGRPVADAKAAAQEALELTGQGRSTWLLWGHDASLPRGGDYVAWFSLRGAATGWGDVWLEAAPAGGAATAAKTVRLEELPPDAYRRVALHFRYQPGTPMEYRLAAERGTLRADAVVVVPGAARERRRAEPRERFRRPRALADVWGTARQAVAPDLRIERLGRSFEPSGWYTFRVFWRYEGAEPRDGVGLDLWVATRSEGGRVTTFDRAAAYDAVEPGRHQTAARLGPRTVREYGVPVAFFAHIYSHGVAADAAWRKWGIPVDDKWILEAKRGGALQPPGR
ncbi:MAG: hypothetical protein ACLF0G_17075 [Candidatus Brocadiia bacterium]